MANEKVTANPISAPTDIEQSPANNNHSVPQNQPEGNDNFPIDPFADLDEMMSPYYLCTASLTQIYETSYKPKAQIIENFLCAGVYLFAGAPKVGKSFFMAQLGYHVSCGIDLWGYKLHKGAVLYLALEDDYPRLQKRLSRMFGTDGVDNFYFATHVNKLKEGLDGQLEEFLRKHPDTKLVIIDTLQKVREIGGDKYSYSSDYEIITQLKRFADQRNICILIVHHTRKQAAEDCFETISGTNGLLGAADGAFILQKEKRTDNKAILDIVGRDYQDQRLHLLFDNEHCIWHLVKLETELWKEPTDPLLEAVAKILTPETPEWSGNASELMDRLDMDEMGLQPQVLTRQLNVRADRLWNEYGIRLENSRTSTSRIIKLTLERLQA